MPAFLLVTGYLVNIDKSKREFAIYLIRLFLPYLIMVIGFSVLSYYLPVHDRLTEMTVKAIMTKVFITSIGPYWFLQTMMICGAVYYTCFSVLRSHLEIISILLVFCFSLIIVADSTQSLSIKAVPYYFLGAALRQSHINFTFFFRKSPCALLPIIVLLSHDEMRDWGSLSILFVAYSLICFLLWLNGLVQTWGMYKHILFVGANTLPIFLFHPIFTMLAKYYLPLFDFDSSGVMHAVITLIIATTGSILVAYIMDKSGLSYLFGSRAMLRRQ